MAGLKYIHYPNLKKKKLAFFHIFFAFELSEVMFMIWRLSTQSYKLDLRGEELYNVQLLEIIICVYHSLLACDGLQ